MEINMALRPVSTPLQYTSALAQLSSVSNEKTLAMQSDDVVVGQQTLCWCCAATLGNPSPPQSPPRKASLMSVDTWLSTTNIDATAAEDPLSEMLDSELIFASARASRSGQSQLSAVEEAEAVTLAMVRQFAPSLDERSVRRAFYVNHAKTSLEELEALGSGGRAAVVSRQLDEIAARSRRASSASSSGASSSGASSSGASSSGASSSGASMPPLTSDDINKLDSPTSVSLPRGSLAMSERSASSMSLDSNHSEAAANDWLI